MTATAAPDPRPAGTAALAWVVVLVTAGVAALIIVVSAFSQNNTPASVDGDKAVYSHWLDDAHRDR